MADFERILVDIDATAAAHPALQLAIDCARRASAELTIVDVLGQVPDLARRFVTDRIEAELLAHRTELLQAIEREIPHGLAVRTAILRGKPTIAIVHEVLRGRHDLLFRSHGRDMTEAPPPYGAVDMQLLRKCPCPVWLVAPGHEARPKQVLAAVDASTDDPVEQALNRRILELAVHVCELERASLTVLHAWATFGERLLEHRMEPGEFHQFVDSTREFAGSAIESLLASTDLGSLTPRVELRKGLPQHVIPSFARTQKMDLVVMGTVARTGVAGLVIGNTAESVLQQLRGSVLTVKPEGFTSPIRPPGRR